MRKCRNGPGAESSYFPDGDSNNENKWAHLCAGRVPLASGLQAETELQQRAGRFAV